MCSIKESTHHSSTKRIHLYSAVGHPKKHFGKERTLTSAWALSIFISIALACIVGSEHGQVYSASTASSNIDWYQSLTRRFVRGFYKSHEDEPLLTNEQLDSYTRDGFIVISGLLDTHEIDSLVVAGENLISKKTSDGKLSAGNYQYHEFGLALGDKPFRKVALHSYLPSVAAQLLRLDRKSQNLRVLRDVFLAKGHESTSSCGWHIDDQLFWPQAYTLSKEQEDSSGINAWIALDDMPIDMGGSMAVSPASHTQDFSWRDDAYEALNFNERFSNGVSKDDLVELIKSGKVDSCGLEKFAPHLYDDIELTKQEFNFKRGDVIFMNRWLFHKSTPVTEKGRQALQAVQSSHNDSGSALLKRYSLRYATGSSSLPGGFVTELSVLADEMNLGQQLNSVSGDWYPQVWPEIDPTIEERIDHLVKNEVPEAQAKLGQIMAEVMAMFQSK